MVKNKKYEIGKRDIFNMVELNTIFSIPYDEKVLISTINKKPAIYYSSRLANRFRLIAKYLVEGEFEEKEDFFRAYFH